MDEEIKKIVRLMMEKGYPREFSIVPDLRAARWGRPQRLEDCLSTWLSVDHSEVGLQRPLYLSCQFYSSLHRENMECRFELKYSGEGGAEVTGLRIELKDRMEQKWMQFQDTREVPGFRSIEGMFNRKSPWDDEMRGRFRRH